MKKKAPFNIFVSSTYRDLENERKQVIKAIEKVCKAIGMEKFLPDEKTTLEVCLENLKKCDIYIGIIGSRYGSIIPIDQLKVEDEKYRGLSFTHYEFKKANELGIPRVVFIKKESEKEEGNEEIKKFKEEIKKSIFPSYFSNLDELSEKVENFLKEKIPEWVFEGKLKIPSFYGREKELCELYEEITDENQICSVVNVFGIGGIGKTAFVEALLLLLSIKGYLAWEVRSTEGRETTFSTPENYKSDILKFSSIRGLMQLLGIEIKENIEDSLISWLDDNKVVLFIDDFQKLEDNFKDFINKAYKTLRNGKIIVASRGRANVKCHLYKELLSLKEESCKEMIRSELRNASFKPNEEIIEVIYEKTKGHPLAIKMLVPLISKYKLSVDKLKEFGSISNVQDEEEVKEFISRTFLENVRDKRDYNVFKYLSVLKDGFDYDILRAILKMLNDKRYKLEDEKLLREFLSQFIPHIISYDYNRKIFNFSHDMVKEATYSQVKNVEEARGKILEALREMNKKLLAEKKIVFVNEEIFYQAEEIIKFKGENKKLMHIAFESSYMLTNYGYREYIPLMSYEYGKKALYYAEKLKRWIKVLEIAEHALFYAVELLIPEEEARVLYNKANEVFPKALKLNEKWARFRYAYAVRCWAFYTLDSLINFEEADSSLEKAFKEVGNKDSRKIKDELLWHDAYSALLTIRSILFRYKEDLEMALRVLKEKEELLEYYKDKIIKRWGKKAYYHDKLIIMDERRELMFERAKSENDLKKVLNHDKDYIMYALKVENIKDMQGLAKQCVTKGRIKLIITQMMLAKNQDDFRNAVYDKIGGFNLEDCIETFKEKGDRYYEALAKECMAICYLALKRDDDALKFVSDLIEIVKKGPDEYLKASCELILAYIMMTSRLSDFKKGELSNEIYELIQNAYEKLEKIVVRQSSRLLIALAIKVIAKYLKNEINFDEFLNELNELTKELENGGGRIGSWIIKQLIDTIRKKGGIDEDFLRLKGAKLLLIL